METESLSVKHVLSGMLDDGQSPDIKQYNNLNHKFSNEAKAFQLSQNVLYTIRTKDHQKSSHDNHTGLYTIQNIHKR
jgi:hypothetical protein